MKVKVCGLTEQNNIKEVIETGPDYVGFIFYKGSKRCIQKLPLDIPSSSQKVGVFVNERFEEIYRVVSEYKLDMVQLHGEESPSLCKQLREAGIPVIKAIPVQNQLSLECLSLYDVDFFLFDTAGPLKGGNGFSFDWQLLCDASIETPFLIGGGLDYDSIATIKSLHLPNLVGLDFNSRLEDQPGIKNIKKVKQIIHGIRN